jgi:hypothetical protein
MGWPGTNGVNMNDTVLSIRVAPRYGSDWYNYHYDSVTAILCTHGPGDGCSYAGYSTYPNYIQFPDLSSMQGVSYLKLEWWRRQ